MDESELTEKQREWLDLSRKIGPGQMTKSERLSLERLYKEMLPREQQELFRYIQSAFAKKEGAGPDEAPDPISLMEQRVWKPASSALKGILSKRLGVKGRGRGSDTAAKES